MMMMQMMVRDCEEAAIPDLPLKRCECVLLTRFTPKFHGAVTD